MVKIGLEVHGYLRTREKLFCRCKAESSDSQPNTNICPICTGQPGAKPMLPNSEAVKKILQVAAMLNSKVNTMQNNKKLIWQRKHYSWPDLPKGYQNTMSGSYSIPIAEHGEFLGIRITEMHLEEDPAAWNPETGTIDYNRSGHPLIEIVTEPDFKTSEQVISWIKQLLLTLSYIKAVKKDAGIKIDVNVSTHGERVEIKNMNSLANIKQAIEYEIKRQNKEKKILRETRRYDNKKQKTQPMREKEQVADYRFIPDPDLPVVKVKQQSIYQIKSCLPETPQQKLLKIIKKHKVGEKQAKILTSNLEIAEFFEKISQKIPPKLATKWVLVELLRILNYNKTTLDQVEIKPEHFIELIKLVQSKKITELKAKQILNKFIPRSFKPTAKGQETIKSTSKIQNIVDRVLKNNKPAVADYLEGKESALNFLIGQVMRQSNRRADFKTTREIILKKLRE